MIPQIAIQLIFEGNYDDALDLIVPAGYFGGTFEKVGNGLQYKSVYVEEYYLEELLEKFLVYYEKMIRPLYGLLVKADGICLCCCVYAADTIPSINLSKDLMRAILNLHENVSLDIDIVLTESDG